MKSRKGQISVLVLLLSMMGLVIGLSTASRSLSDLKQVTYVDSGTRALAAAEAGLQFAFSDQKNWVADCLTDKTVPLSLTGIPVGGVKYRVCQGADGDWITVHNIAADDVFQLDLSSSPSKLKSFDIFWKGAASVDIEIIDSDNSMRRYAYNADGQVRGNGFATGLPLSSCSTALCDPAFTSGSCTGIEEILYKVGTPPVSAQLVRIKPLYLPSDISVCGRFAGLGGTSRLRGTQFYTVVVTATTTNGTVRRLQADNYPAALPAIFDNVFYSGGDIVK